jgi:hypothetical protein
LVNRKNGDLFILEGMGSLFSIHLAVCTACGWNDGGSLAAIKSVRASAKVVPHDLSTMPFCSGV